jgi:plastocyanin
MTRLFALSLLALVLAAPASAASSSTILHISALGSGLRYSTTHLKAVHGKVTIVMKNLSPLQHDIAIKGNGVTAKGKVVGKGKTSTVTVTLKKGVYTFYCSVDAHAAAGMKGTLTIT